MNKFLVIDGNSIMNRAFYGLANLKMFSKTAGIHTNAIYAFLNIYWMILDKLKPDYIAVSFDLKATTFRHKMYSEYKGTRKGMPDELAEQMPVIKEILTAMNVPIIELEGYEADDILGTVAKINDTNNIFTYILTGDKDSFQLIGKNVSVVIPTNRAGKTEYTIYTPDLLKEKQNIEPYQIIDIKSLMGDSSDNIPGVKGIGEKTAYNLIWKYTTLENIYDNIDNLEVTSKIKEKLVNDRDMAFLSKTLATIDTDVPINLDYNICKVSDVNKNQLYRLFRRLEFSKFMEKYDLSKIDITQNMSEKNEVILEELSNQKKFVILDGDNILKYIDDLKNIFNETEISYILNIKGNENFETNLRMQNKSFFGIYSPIKDYIYILDIDKIIGKNNQIYFDIMQAFALSNSNKLGYNVKQDIRYIFNNICERVHNFNYDIMIAYYLMDSVRVNYDIEYILNDLFGIILNLPQTNKKINEQLSLFSNEEENKEFLSEEDKKNITIYLKSLYKSKNQVLDKLSNLGMLSLFNDIEMPLTETLASMEHIGMYIDVNKLNEFDKEICSRLEILEHDIYTLAGMNFNINSPQQLGHILFEVLNLPTGKKGKTGYSTNKEVLEELSDKHEIINLILEYRQTIKLKTTYVDGLKSKIASDGRIHTTFMQTVTSTGRLSSIEPNLQNIPVRLELGRKIRKFFIAPQSNVIVDADYSQIELRVLAHISQDETMIDAFKHNIDIHKVTASQVFGVPLEEVTSEMRGKAKAVNFGIVYGISEYGLAKNISTTRKEAAIYIDNYLTKYHKIKDFMENIVVQAREDGYVTTLFGRRRYISELSSKNKMKVQFGKRIAMNTPIQGTAADIIKLAMNRIYNKLKINNLKSKLIMQVHDELIVETVPDELDKIKEIMYEAMEHVINLSVPLDIDLNTGKSWYDAK